MNRTMNLILMGLVSFVLASAGTASAQDLCAPSVAANKAKRTLDRAEALLRAGSPAVAQAISSSGIGNCRGSDIIAAGANPGEMIPHFMGPVTCGAVLTFATPAQVHAAASYLRNRNLGGAVCVMKNFANPHPVVSSGN